LDCNTKQSPCQGSGMTAGTAGWDHAASGCWGRHGSISGSLQVEQQLRCSAASFSSSMLGGQLPSGDRQQAVEDLLQANARLLQKLAE
jgi:hypothetical protein